MRRLNESYLRRIIREEKARLTTKKPRLSSLIFEQSDDEIKDKYLPTELDKVDPKVARTMATAGQMDKDKSDDVVEVTPQTWAASDLKPSQTTMRIGNTVGMALSMLAGKMDTNLGCIVSSDNHIMDGHHRWSAAILVDPTTKVSGYAAALPGKELLGVLNVLTKGVFGKAKGNKGEGAIDGYTPEAVKAELEKQVAAGTKFLKPEKIKSLLEEKYGSVEKGIETMSKNVESMSKEVPGWAPDRIQMPVIDPKEVPKAASVLNKGNADVKPPFSVVVKKSISGSEKSAAAKEKKDESVESSDQVIMERWGRLAGLIKD